MELHNMHPQWRKSPHNSGALSHRAIAQSQPSRMGETPFPENPNQSQQLAQHRYQRASPSQAPYLRVAPRINPIDVSSPRVMHTLPITDVIPLAPHPAAENAPYVPEGMAGMKLFDTFEEEHMETPALPRYNTRARARQHSTNQAQFLSPRINK
jgi:hypothetical protein